MSSLKAVNLQSSLGDFPFAPRLRFRNVVVTVSRWRLKLWDLVLGEATRASRHQRVRVRETIFIESTGMP